MKWIYADGTVVELGGVVKGASRWAMHLRRALEPEERPRLENPVPSASTPLDTSHAGQFDVWLDQQNCFAPKEWGIELIERPTGFDPWVRPVLPQRQHEPGELVVY